MVAIDKLCKLCDLEGEEFEKELESFEKSLKVRKKDSGATEEDHVVRYGINAYYKDAGTRAGQLESRLNSEKDTSLKKAILKELRNELLDKTDQNAEFIGNLLDYQRIIKFDLKEAIPLTKEQKKEEPEEQKETREKRVKEIFIEEAHEHGFDETDIAKITRTSIKDLTRVLSRHLKIIKFAFPNLNQELGRQSKYDDVVDNFLEKEVCGKQGWEDAVYKNEETFSIETINKTFLKKEITKLDLSKTITTAASHSR